MSEKYMNIEDLKKAIVEKGIQVKGKNGDYIINVNEDELNGIFELAERDLEDFKKIHDNSKHVDYQKFIEFSQKKILEKMGKIYLNSEEAWNLLCKTVFKYHENEINKLDELQQIIYLQGLSELEYKIYAILKIGGIVNNKLVLHKDFPKVWNFFRNKLK